MDLLITTLGQAFAPVTAAFVIATIGLNFHFGLTGLLNMGHAGFMLIGMYGFAISIQNGISMWLAVVIAMVAAMIFALLLGWPTLKLRGDYLAIVTIAAAEMVRYLGRSQSLKGLTGGSSGILGNDYKDPFESLSPFPASYVQIGPFNYSGSSSSSWWLRVVAWGIVAVALLFYMRLSRSPWGRVQKGIREDEDAVRSLGKNVYWYKMQSLVIGGCIGALGGIIWALANSVQPDSMGRATTFWIWTMLLLGGAATVFGPVLGSIIFWSGLTLIRGLAQLFIPESVLDSNDLQPFSLLLVGVTLMALVVFRPQGVLGDKKELVISG